MACHGCSLRLRSEPEYQNPVIFYFYLKTDAPRALVFRPLVKGNEALGTRLKQHAKQSTDLRMTLTGSLDLQCQNEQTGRSKSSMILMQETLLRTSLYDSLIALFTENYSYLW